MQERQYENLGKTDKVGRGPNIPTDWRKYIIEQAIGESHKPRMLLADEILEQMHQSSDINHEQLPERESVARLISHARNHPPDPEDAPWSIDTLDKLPIPTEALRIVLWIWFRQQERGYPLSIREAKWIVRLYPFYGDVDNELKLAWDLERDAKKWAVVELVTDVAGDTLDWRVIQIELYERLTNQKVDPELRRKLLSAPKDWPQKKRRLQAQSEEEFLQRKKKEAQHERSHNQKR